MNKTALLLPILTALALAACKQEPAGVDAATAGAPREKGFFGIGGGDDAEDEAAVAASPGLPEPDMKKPLESYPELQSGQQIMFLYVAASKLPPDFAKLAESFSQEYRNTSDSFRKNDLLNAIKPQLEQKIKEAEASPYAWMQVVSANLGPYDFERKGFPVREFEQGRERYFYDGSNYRLTWANVDEIQFVSVPDEAKARELEALRNIAQGVQMKIYFFAQSADLNRQVVNAYVTRIRFTDRDGRVLVEYGPERG